MKIPSLAEAMGYVDEELVALAESYMPQSKKNRIERFSSIGFLVAAACICLVIVRVIPVLLMGPMGGNEPGGIQTLPEKGYFAEDFVVYQDVPYIILDSEKELAHYQLPEIITLDMVGQMEGECIVSTNDGEKEFWVYEYMGSTDNKIKMLCRGGTYVFMIQETP